jgi:hypothetical protein
MRAQVAEHGYVEGEGMIRWVDFGAAAVVGSLPMINRRILGEKYGLEVAEHYVGGYSRSNGFNCAPDVIVCIATPRDTIVLVVLLCGDLAWIGFCM